MVNFFILFLGAAVMIDCNSDPGRSIKKLLKDYEKPQKGELADCARTPMKEWRVKQKIRYAEVVMDRLNMPKSQLEQVSFIIMKIPFKSLCARCKDETIITALCLYIKFACSKKRNVNAFAICNENGVDEAVYAKVVTRIAIYFQSQLPLVMNVAYNSIE